MLQKFSISSKLSIHQSILKNDLMSDDLRYRIITHWIWWICELMV